MQQARVLTTLQLPFSAQTSYPRTRATLMAVTNARAPPRAPSPRAAPCSSVRRSPAPRRRGSQARLRMQAMLYGHQDAFDQEVGALSQAVGKLKGMATAIGEEAQETGKLQDAVAKQLEAAQVRAPALAAAPQAC